MKWLILIIFIALQIEASLSQGFPGPQTVRPLAPGSNTEVYEAKQHASGATLVYTVKDFGASRPRMVYNCAYLRALCNNARQYLTRNGLGNTAVLHYDRGWRGSAVAGGLPSNHRTDARRDESCPRQTWIRTLRPNGRPRCPEDDQPFFLTEDHGIDDWQRVRMYRERVPEGAPDHLQHWDVSFNVIGDWVDHDENGNEIWFEAGYSLSCDEFPGASMIEGGQGRNLGAAARPASTYCAPINGCTGWGSSTEQNWQSSANGQLLTLFREWMPSAARYSNSVAWTIMRFDFELRTDSTIQHAIWLEKNNVRRYCYGPMGTGC